MTDVADFTHPPHPRIAGRRVIDLDRLSKSQRDTLGQELYAIHSQIFAGVPMQKFRHTVLEPEGGTSAVQLYLNDAGEIVGYCAVHEFHRQAQGRDCIVLVAQAGLRPEYRGRGATYWFGAMRALRTKLRHPFSPVYYLDGLVHYSSYHLFCKYFPRVYPGPDGEIPDTMRAIAVELIDSFDDPAVDPADPLVRDVGWITIETPQEKALAQRRDLPDIRFFKQRNPGYVNGNGLVVLVPMTFGNILAGMAARLAECTRAILRRRHPQL